MSSAAGPSAAALTRKAWLWTWQVATLMAVLAAYGAVPSAIRVADGAGGGPTLVLLALLAFALAGIAWYANGRRKQLPPGEILTPRARAAQSWRWWCAVFIALAALNAIGLALFEAVAWRLMGRIIWQGMLFSAASLVVWAGLAIWAWSKARAPIIRP